MRFNSHAAAAVKVFGKKILPARWRFFFQNPQGLTFTADKRNGYLCIYFFSGQNIITCNSNKSCVATQIKSKNTTVKGVGGRGLARA